VHVAGELSGAGERSFRWSVGAAAGAMRPGTAAYRQFCRGWATSPTGRAASRAALGPGGGAVGPGAGADVGRAVRVCAGRLGPYSSVATARDGMDAGTLGTERVGPRPLGTDPGGFAWLGVGSRALGGWEVGGRTLGWDGAGRRTVGPRTLGGSRVGARALGRQVTGEGVGAWTLGTSRSVAPRTLAVRDGRGKRSAGKPEETLWSDRVHNCLTAPAMYV